MGGANDILRHSHIRSSVLVLLMASLASHLLFIYLPKKKVGTLAELIRRFQ